MISGAKQALYSSEELAVSHPNPWAKVSLSVTAKWYNATLYTVEFLKLDTILI
jgi:hypothetical protein